MSSSIPDKVVSSDGGKRRGKQSQKKGTSKPTTAKKKFVGITAGLEHAIYDIGVTN